MTSIQVFDPAMCCSTGICGPSVDPQLVRFAADLAWLKSQGVHNIVIDASSIEVERGRRVKTDRVDGDKLLALLMGYHAGERL